MKLQRPKVFRDAKRTSEVRSLKLLEHRVPGFLHTPCHACLTLHTEVCPVSPQGQESPRATGRCEEHCVLVVIPSREPGIAARKDKVLHFSYGHRTLPWEWQFRERGCLALGRTDWRTEMGWEVERGKTHKIHMLWTRDTGHGSKGRYKHNCGNSQGMDRNFSEPKKPMWWTPNSSCPDIQNSNSKNLQNPSTSGAWVSTYSRATGE